MKKVLWILLIAFLGCSKSAPDPVDNGKPDPDPLDPGTGAPIGDGNSGVIGINGIADWDKLPNSERNKIKNLNTIFMHQSVGGDLEDGAEANGFKFEYFDLTQKPNGLSGNVFSASNGDPLGKIAEFTKNVIVHKSVVKIAIFKFGYADIQDDNIEIVKVAYKQMVDNLKKEVPGLRFVHITPPLIYIVTKDDGNAAKMKISQWMKDTFKEKDVIYDLEEIESNNGSCKLGNVWTICDQYRSTVNCASKSQGVDAPEGQGHICEKEAERMSKSLLMSIYNAGK